MSEELEEGEEKTKEIVVVEKHFLGRSWTDIFWLVGAGALAAVGWKLIDRWWPKGQGQNTNPPQG